MYKQLFECQNIIRRLELKKWNSVHFISQQIQEEAGVGSVDCQKYRSFCQEQGVNSYPTIRLYPHNSQGARRFVWVLKRVRAMLVWPWKMVSVSVRFLFYQPMDENIKIWTLRFPPKENSNTEKALFDWPIMLQYDVKAKDRLISRKFSSMTFFQLSVRLTNQKLRAFVSVR